jgi:hypothetical protein
LALGRGDTIVAVGTTSDPSRPTNLGADFALARLDASGALDPTFGMSGRYVQDFFGASDVAQTVAVTSGGAIVAAGGVRNGATPGHGLMRLAP